MLKTFFLLPDFSGEFLGSAVESPRTFNMESLVKGVNSISNETTNKTRVILVHFLMAYSGLGTRSSNLILILFEVNRLSKPRIFLLTAEVRSRFYWLQNHKKSPYIAYDGSCSLWLGF